MKGEFTKKYLSFGRACQLIKIYLDVVVCRAQVTACCIRGEGVESLRYFPRVGHAIPVAIDERALLYRDRPRAPFDSRPRGFQVVLAIDNARLGVGRAIQWTHSGKSCRSVFHLIN